MARVAQAERAEWYEEEEGRLEDQSEAPVVHSAYPPAQSPNAMGVGNEYASGYYE